MIDHYEGGLVGEPDTNFELGQSAVRGLSTPSTTFRVRAVQRSILDPLLPPVAGPYGAATVVVDRTPPTISSVAFSPSLPNGFGWYRSLLIDWTCSDTGGSGPCPRRARR